MWEHFLHVACMLIHLCLSSNWFWKKKKKHFGNICHLNTLCASVPSQEANGKVAGTVGGVCPNSMEFACSWNFLQITQK